jgi:hypothetical protein
VFCAVLNDVVKGGGQNGWGVWPELMKQRWLRTFLEISQIMREKWVSSEQEIETKSMYFEGDLRT